MKLQESLAYMHTQSLFCLDNVTILCVYIRLYVKDNLANDLVLEISEHNPGALFRKSLCNNISE